MSRVQSERKPWYRIAWAFLRPSGKTCRSRIGKRIRLQLYRYQKEIFGQSTEGTEVLNEYVLYESVQAVAFVWPQL